MAKTYAECEAQVIAAHPTFSVQTGEEVSIITPASDPDTYAMMVDERATWCVEQSARQEAQDAERQEGRDVMGKVTALETTADRLRSAEAFSNAQLRNFMAEHMDVTAEVMRYLNKKSADPITPEEVP
jgi:hypothetical protein